MITADDIKVVDKNAVEIGHKNEILDNVSTGSIQKPSLPTATELNNGNGIDNEGYTYEAYNDTEINYPFYAKLDFSKPDSTEDNSSAENSSGDSGVVMTTEL